MKAYAQAQRKQEIKEEDTFSRPEPSRPIQPELPSTNRYQEDKIFLEYADSLYKQTHKRDTIEKQILKGNVKFRQADMWMYCDSAYYYPEENSLDAFSNVRMEQGDTLFVYADQLFYNGDTHLAKLKNGPTRSKVTLINNDVTLTTDSLDYDMNIDLGWYTRWGTIDDKVNTLTSLYGEYSPATKRAEFFTDVELVNSKDGFVMLTDTLYYSTETHIAEIESRTIIQGENDTIITNLATYYTDSGNADLLSRSLIIHRDSTGNVTTLEGDSIIYDNATRVSRAYMFQDPFKRSAPMVITDTAQKTTLIGGFGIYNDSTKEALATIYPLLMEYSQNDTIFLRADTIKTYIVTEMVADRRRKTKSGFPEHMGIPIVMPDSVNGGLWIDTTFFAVKIPYVETPLVMLLKEAPPAKPKNEAAQMEISTLASELHESFPADSIGALQKIAELDSINVERNLAELDSTGRVKNQIGDYISEDFERMSQREDTISADTIAMAEEILRVDSIPVEHHVALAYHRARFFKQDMQGVADSMVFLERDSILYMFRKPIIWSGERQVTGNRIDVHFNDSTADWALLPEFGLMSEHVEEDFYNQIFGKELKAYFEGNGLRRMEVNGNVETIFLPQEEDSTYNRLVNAESSYLDAYLTDNELDRLKMWPEVSGTVTPLFLVKRAQMYLQKFKWWGFLRPEREWYGDRLRWADNLGEVPEELEQYFLSPSDFGEPKSFTGARFTPPPTSLITSAALPDLMLNDSIGARGDSLQVVKIEESETLPEIESMENEEHTELIEMEEEGKEIEDAVEDADAGESGLQQSEIAVPEEEEDATEVVGNDSGNNQEEDEEELIEITGEEEEVTDE